MFTARLNLKINKLEIKLYIYNFNKISSQIIEMGPCKNQCTIWQTLNEPYGRIVSVQVTTWENWSDHESPTSLHTPDVSLFSHMFMTVKAILWDYVHHMRDPTMSAMWIYKLPWETSSDLESHYICFEFVIIRVMGKCFVMNHAVDSFSVAKRLHERVVIKNANIVIFPLSRAVESSWKLF